mgnify:CR=1 FL=1
MPAGSGALYPVYPMTRNFSGRMMWKLEASDAKRLRELEAENAS